MNALIALCNRMDAQDGPRIDRDLQGALPPLRPEVELVLYRIAQESLTNAIRHAHARSISSGCRATRSRWHCACATTATACRARCPSGSSGIAGMRERAILVGARFSIESNTPARDRGAAQVPLDQNGR